MQAPVLTGIEVLKREGFGRLHGRSIGLITNHTGLDESGSSTADLIHQAVGSGLRTLFGPEHGIRGEVDAPVADGIDARTGLPVFSLYGERHSPTAAQLNGIDLLVFDIQDVGARFYTYSSTLGLCLEAAAKHGVGFMVLDRPNPIGGARLEGPIADSDSLSFVAHHTVPIRHGLTLGEFARMLNAEKSLKVDLAIVHIEGWQRSEMFDATGLVWTNPSPNMRSLTQALIYPGLCLIEYTNISVGRGTDSPFEIFGAPWMRNREVAAALNNANLPGARFVPMRFKPAAGKFAGETCEGINLIVIDRARFMPVLTGIGIIESLLRHHRSEWQPESVNRLLVNRASFERILSGESARSVARRWTHDLEVFEARRRPHLIY